MQLTRADLVAVERELCKRSLAHFARRAWHVLEPAAELKWGWALDAICQHLEAVTDGRVTRLLMNVPPGPMRCDSSVETGRGVVRLDQVRVGDVVLTHKGRYRQVLAVHDQGTLPILKITTHSGRETYAAPTHPYLTPRGWVEAKDLKIGDALAVVNRQEERLAPCSMTESEARFIGYIVGDGGVTHSPSFVNGDRDVIDDFMHCCNELGFRTTERKRKTFWIIGISGAKELLQKHGLLGANSYTKRIPKDVMNSSASCLRAFLGAYWSCDGGIDVRPTSERGSKFRAYATTVSEQLAHDLVMALGLVGIEARLRRKTRKLETIAQPGGVYRSFSIEVQNQAMTARIIRLPALCDRKTKMTESCSLDFDRTLWEDPVVSIEQQQDAHCMCLTVEEDHSFTCSGIAVKNSMKSLLTGVIWPAWEWGPRNMPEMRFVGTAHEEQLAIRDSRRCRDLIKSDWYQSLWPIELLADLDGKREFGNTRKGVRQARSFTSMTGVRGDRVLLDDPLSADGANSQAKLEAAKIAFTETLPTRVNSEKSAIVVIMQRLHEDDTSGVILKMGLPYVHLCIPMQFERDRRCVTSIGWEDPRTEDGELMFPERFGEQQVRELEATLGTYGTAGQLQQRPSPRGGGMLKSSWLTYWHTVPPALDFRYITADTAQKTSTQHDYSVLQCWGRSVAGKAVLLDQIRGKWEAPELVTEARAFWFKHLHDGRPIMSKAPLRAMYVEDKVSGTGLIQTLRRESITVLPVQRSKDKQARGYDAAPFIEAGNVAVPQDAPWLSDFLTEFSTFPNGAHDDQLDPLFDAVHLCQVSHASVKSVSVALPRVNRW